MAKKLKSGTICIIIESWNSFKKGDILIIGDSDSGEAGHYHYDVRKVIKPTKGRDEFDVCCDVIKPYTNEFDVKDFHLKEIEKHIKRLFKKQHYYKKYILPQRIYNA